MLSFLVSYVAMCQQHLRSCSSHPFPPPPAFVGHLPSFSSLASDTFGMMQTVGVCQNLVLFCFYNSCFPTSRSLSQLQFEHMHFHIISATKWSVQCSNVQLNYLKNSLHPCHLPFQGKQNKYRLLIADRI